MGDFPICCVMGQSKLERAARLRAVARHFRGYAAETRWPQYKALMLEAAGELEREAAKLDSYRGFAIAS